MLLLNKLKKVIICSVIFFAILFLSCSNYAIVSPTKDFYVNDYANLLSETTKEYIIQTNIDLNQKTGAQIVIVTVKNLEGMSIEDYANQLFRKFEIGDKEKNNGLLLLCSYEDRMFRVEVGYGLEGCLPDGKTGRLQDEYIIPYLKENKFEEGIKNGYNAFLEEVEKEYKITIDQKEDAILQENSPNVIQNISMFGGIWIGIILGFFIRLKSKRKGFIAYGISLLIVLLLAIFWLKNYIYFVTYFIFSGLGLLIFSGRGTFFIGGPRGFGGFGGGSFGGFSRWRWIFWWWRKF